MALVIVYVALVAPVLWVGVGNTDDARDQKNYHEPFITQLISQWPHVDLINTHGLAMTPGYHLLLSALSYYGGIGVLGLRIITAIIGGCMLLTVFWFCARWTTPRSAFLLTQPLMLSSFVLGSSMWLRPDNISLLAAAFTLGIITCQTPNVKLVLLLGCIISIAVFVRQVNIWLLAPLLLFVVGPPSNRSPHAVSQAHRFNGRRIWLMSATTITATALPLGVLWYFYQLWGGLLPPAVAAVHPVGNGFSNLAVIFALTGFFGLFFILLGPRPHLNRVLNDPWIYGAAFVGFLISTIPPTGDPVGPSGFLVEAQKTPILFGRVVLLIPLAAMGGAVIAILLRASFRDGRQRPATLLLMSFLIWSLAMAANVYVFRRYCEPFILICLAWWTSMCFGRAAFGKVSLLMLFIVLVIQASLSVIKIYVPVISELRHF
jgi:hypothetical protein